MGYLQTSKSINPCSLGIVPGISFTDAGSLLSLDYPFHSIAQRLSLSQSGLQQANFTINNSMADPHRL